MARVQVYVSDEVSEKIRVIAEKRRAEGARDKDVSFSSIASMLSNLVFGSMKRKWKEKSLPLIRRSIIKLFLKM